MTQTRLHFDYEAKSEIDLFDRGADVYTSHSSTTILMASWSLDDDPTELWVPAEGERMPSNLRDALRDPAVLKVAFNAQFERLMTWRVALRQFGIEVEQSYEQWRCSMALAYMFSFMGGLDDIADQMSLKYRKDPRGKQLINIFCKPNKPTKNQPFVWRDMHSDPEQWETFKKYCIRDNESEKELWNKLIKFGVPDWQWELYALDQIINDRGLPINRQFVQNALDIAGRRKSELISAQNEITGLQNANSGTQLLPWLIDRGYPYENLRKENVQKALVAEEEEVAQYVNTPVPQRDAAAIMWFGNVSLDTLGHVVGDAVMTQECRTVLRMRQSSAKTSTTKYEATMDRLGDDNRLRYCFQFAGASRTNRWAGRALQPQNLPRTPKWLEPESYIDFDRLDYCNSLIQGGHYGLLGLFAGDQMDAVAACVRSVIQAPEGKKLVVCDLSSIESVVIFWLTDCERGLNVFWNGLCAYKDFATTLYGVAYEEVTKAQRSGAKPGVLGAGYRLSGGELVNGEKTGLWGYAENMGIKMTLEEAHRAVSVFRETYKEIKNAWYQIEDTIERAMMAGGKEVSWGPLKFQIVKPFLKVTLPSGRPMWYYQLRVEKFEAQGRYGPYMRTNISYMGKDQVTNQWRRIDSHGGKFIENFVQALARDILGFGMLAAHAAGFFIVGHVHDEIISEEAANDNEKTVEALRYCMTKAVQERFEFARTMPLNAAGYEGPVYKKD